MEKGRGWWSSGGHTLVWLWPCQLFKTGTHFDCSVCDTGWWLMFWPSLLRLLVGSVTRDHRLTLYSLIHLQILPAPLWVPEALIPWWPRPLIEEWQSHSEGSRGLTRDRTPDQQVSIAGSFLTWETALVSIGLLTGPGKRGHPLPLTHCHLLHASYSHAGAQVPYDTVNVVSTPSLSTGELA
jgi:hypothetical protein